jgi:two-component system, NarL family, sensor histidine kinase DesK
MRCLPENNEHGWSPWVWLLYFGFFYLDPILGHAGWEKWLATAIGTVVFLFLYFGFFWAKPQRRLWCVAGLAVMGFLYAPYHGGAATFFIYAACFLPFAVETQALAVKLLVTLVALVSIECLLFHLPLVVWLYSAVFSAVLGTGNVFFAERNRANARLRLANEEIERLARVAERERIARDLHDVLGHTLSLIILKSELAVKLIDRDPERAKAEIRDVEATSRDALEEVRATIRGYRCRSLEAEWKAAEATLETAGVTVHSEADAVLLSPAQEGVVALVVREAVTNVVRHANATRCSLRLMPVNGSCRLQIEDNGCGGDPVEGTGLRGMRERIEALGGSLLRETASGTRLTIEFPLTQGEGSSFD